MNASHGAGRPADAEIRYDTIVVGAGVSGTAAAHVLAAAGQRVLVLEARDRIGGRLHSEILAGRTTDVGGSWIHGISQNPLYEAALAFDLPMREFTVGSYQPGGRPIAYFDPSGARLTDEAAAMFIADVHAFDDELAQTIAIAEPGVSYETVMDRTLDRIAWTGERRERVREFVRHRSEEQLGADATLLDAHGLDDDAIDGDEVVFPSGYDQLPIALARGLDVRFESVVTALSWGATGVKITASTGSFRANRAIVTVPVGVLKAGEIDFAPALPEPIAGALESLRMNSFEKIFLGFDESFWDDELYAFRRQGAAATWWHSWYNLTDLHGLPTLLTFAAGECAQVIREWSDEEIVDSVLTSLREIFGASVPHPNWWRITRWQDDLYAHGSYAFPMAGAARNVHDLVATPLDGGDGLPCVLQLAGETTWQDDPATVTAALLSGQRAAERILGSPQPTHRLWSTL